MRISKISVYGLFDRFNHDLIFNPEERITIMIGPNGFGKTMILRILDALFNRSVRSLGRMPFKEVNVFFDNHSNLNVSRTSSTRSPRNRYGQADVRLEYSQSSRPPEVFAPEAQIGEDDVPFPVNSIDDFIPALDQVGPMEWRDHSTGEILDLEDVYLRYGDELPFRNRTSESNPTWLEEIRKSIPVRFVGTERLTHSSDYGLRTVRSRRHYPTTSPERTVRRYSDKMAQMVQQTLTEYATLAQSLDRTFPARLVEDPPTPALSIDDLVMKLAEVEEKRSKIVDAGLLVQEEEDLRVPVLKEVDQSRRGVLAVYAQDALRKLSVFDDLYDRVNTLKRIANARFLYKQVTVSTNGLEVVSLDGSNLDLEMLSSGEQHELVLLYDLLFGIAENSLIMIDEPELSLHVAWQDEVLSDLQDMARLSNFRVLLATHSPQIIGDRWDLTIELKGPDIQ